MIRSFAALFSARIFEEKDATAEEMSFHVSVGIYRKRIFTCFTASALSWIMLRCWPRSSSDSQNEFLWPFFEKQFENIGAER
jgi:hypothetical protein